MSDAFKLSDHLQVLKGTPYLVEEDQESLRTLEKSIGDGLDVLDVAQETYGKLNSASDAVIGKFKKMTRARLTAESNKIEGYYWTADRVEEAVDQHKFELGTDRFAIFRGIKGDRHLYEALGLYVAQELADQLAERKQKPRIHEIRELHATILGPETLGAGEYKITPNEISGSDLKTIDPIDTPRVMHQMADWWQGDHLVNPILEAAVVQAWLTHIHPFDDGNGRLARLCANVSLSSAGYPALIVKSGTDSGEYYDALATSDGGDILPLYRLFTKILRRSVRNMQKESYFNQVVNRTFLSDVRARYEAWVGHATDLRNHILTELQSRGVVAAPQGLPDLQSFALLSDNDLAGNSWFLRMGSGAYYQRALLWFGFPSSELIAAANFRVEGFPAIQVSSGVDKERYGHPFRPLGEGEITDLPNEIFIRPLNEVPIMLRFGRNLEAMDEKSAAAVIGDCFERFASDVD